jgi:DNA topoisomerase IA
MSTVIKVSIATNLSECFDTDWVKKSIGYALENDTKCNYAIIFTDLGKRQTEPPKRYTEESLVKNLRF